MPISVLLDGEGRVLLLSSLWQGSRLQLARIAVKACPVSKAFESPHNINETLQSLR